MTKTEFCKLIADELLEKGKSVLPGVGVIKVVERAARKGRNPATGEAIDIPASRNIKIAMASALKDRLN